MKIIPAQISVMLSPGSARRNLPFLLWFTLILVVLICIFTWLFHLIMTREGQEHSLLSGLYWTLVTMSTLGFGDITFKSDLGRFFSVLVVLSGMIFLLVLLPFTFIEFFYSPFVKAQQSARAPRSVPPHLKNHVILTHYDAVTAAFIKRLETFRYPYVLAVSDIQQALQWYDLGLKVVVANLEDPGAFAQCGFDRAALVAATGDDFSNTSVAFSARQHSKKLTIVTTASRADSVDVLRLAGSTYVMRLGKLLGEALARRTTASDAQTHLIGSFGELRVAEAMVAGTPLVGKTLQESRLRELVGITVVGLWQKGNFTTPHPTSVLTEDTIWVLAGTEEQMAAYDRLFCIYHRTHAPVVIVGAGRVGRAAAAAFDQSGVEYCIIEKQADRIPSSKNYVVGHADDAEALERAGILNAPAVMITTSEDAVNVYLCIYCRKLRPDIQIVARANTEANVVRLREAGADVVMSYASMGSNILFNLLRRDNTVLVAEGLNIFRIRPPKELIGKTIAKSLVRSRTGCSIIAIQDGSGQVVNPMPDTLIEARHELIMIGTLAAEDAFIQTYRVRHF